MTSFLHMSTKYPGLEYFLQTCVGWIDIKNTVVYHGIQIPWYSNTLVPNSPLVCAVVFKCLFGTLEKAVPRLFIGFDTVTVLCYIFGSKF
jgi:hypothetical protein